MNNPMSTSEIVELLKFATCPDDCDNGSIPYGPNDNGTWGAYQCQFCYERTRAIAALQAQGAETGVTCPTCGGSGDRAYYQGETAEDGPCDNCGGTGAIDSPAQAASEDGPTEYQVYQWFQLATVKHHIQEDGSHISARANYIAQQAWKAAQTARVPAVTTKMYMAACDYWHSSAKTNGDLEKVIQVALSAAPAPAEKMYAVQSVTGVHIGLWVDHRTAVDVQAEYQESTLIELAVIGNSPAAPVNGCDHSIYKFELHGRHCTCGKLMMDFGD